MKRVSRLSGPGGPWEEDTDAFSPSSSLIPTNPSAMNWLENDHFPFPNHDQTIDFSCVHGRAM